MGTKGYFMFIHQGKKYVIYNRLDSQPERLGLTILQEIQRISIEQWIDLIEKCMIIENEKDYQLKLLENDKMNPILFDYFSKEAHFIYHKTDFSDILLHATYTDICRFYDYACSIEKVIKSGYLFIENSILEEWRTYDVEYAYIINFDQQKFIFENINKGITISYSIHHLPNQIVCE